VVVKVDVGVNISDGGGGSSGGGGRKLAVVVVMMVRACTRAIAVRIRTAQKERKR
jgi:hypothetical protein